MLMLICLAQIPQWTKLVVFLVSQHMLLVRARGDTAGVL